MVDELKPGVYFVGALHPDRRLFDKLIPLPDGTSYNSYLLVGSEKTALIDTVDPEKTEILLNNIDSVGPERIDYVIANHAEQDHSGSIPAVLERYPGAQVVCNQKCKGMLIDHLHIPEEKFYIIEDGQELSLGDKTLRFIFTPWVHWPETMSTYLLEDKILFSCDFFGAHIALDGVFVEDKERVYNSAKRYYAEIMMPFAIPIRKNLEILGGLEIDMIAPSHGQVYRDPSFIINAYNDWSSDIVRNVVMIPFISMHDSTRVAVDHLDRMLKQRGIKTLVYDLATADVGEIAMGLLDAATIVFGSPCFLSGIHPSVANAAFIINCLRPKTRFLSMVSSYGWGGRASGQLQEMLPLLKTEMLEPVLIKGLPHKEDLAAIEALSDKIKEKHDGGALR
ncbi:MBL fold hydrolase [Candidatus Woesearchaeota archaeon CG11_big_fil_rev_8_21_14_0_20_43_8]|nr:MAG: MBL fold hydrolase [Candidatus Woesearchaeota archaeon CG11_big_fil_rev_8_21_14_0_20_43_8]PIO05482.1 MAG: MBL fold hydrolase [Candidatus Woesearchaeota archaeon CG08_land_8_20_14_0_20_43_7]